MQDVTRWEYRRRFATAFDEMGICRTMGEEGWELCATWAFWLYFKRPIKK